MMDAVYIAHSMIGLNVRIIMISQVSIQESNDAIDRCFVDQLLSIRKMKKESND